MTISVSKKEANSSCEGRSRHDALRPDCLAGESLPSGRPAISFAPHHFVFELVPRLLFTCAYDGSYFEGWQSQPGGNTVQDALESSLRLALKTPCRVHAAGRTDAGVHACAQRFHLDLPPACRVPLERWPVALNARLPAAIRVIGARSVPDDFHARFSAIGKTYRYRMELAPVLSPFLAGRAWHLPGDLDEARMVRAAAAFCGEHDFRAFAAKRGNEPDPHPEGFFVRSLSEAKAERRGETLYLTFRGTGFLYKMVRLMVGAVYHAGRGKLDEDAIRRLLAEPGSAKSPYCAPACGLYLESVDYGDALPGRE